MLFGSFMYLFERLSPDYPVVTVPGVSSPGAAAAAAGVPLASRNESLLLVPATLDEASLTARLAQANAAVVLKLGRHLGKARRALAAAGLADGACVVSRAGYDDQRIVALADATDDQPYFSLILARRREIPA
jgi:precorrin-2 C(20)-methyltransferase